MIDSPPKASLQMIYVTQFWKISLNVMHIEMHRITQCIKTTAEGLQNFLKYFKLFSGNSRLELQIVTTVKLIGGSHLSF